MRARFWTDPDATKRNQVEFELNKNKAIDGDHSSCKGFSITLRGFESRPGHSRFGFQLHEPRRLFHFRALTVTRTVTADGRNPGKLQHSAVAKLNPQLAHFSGESVSPKADWRVRWCAQDSQARS